MIYIYEDDDDYDGGIFVFTSARRATKLGETTRTRAIPPPGRKAIIEKHIHVYTMYTIHTFYMYVQCTGKLIQRMND